jgi:RNA polymerase sigma factor (TIGR02999 family)
LPRVYDELRRLAAAKLSQEKPGQNLQATALVQEAYVRLVDALRTQAWNSRDHIFAAAAEAMRRILVEQARRRNAVKHGGRVVREPLDAAALVAPAPDEQCWPCTRPSTSWLSTIGFPAALWPLSGRRYRAPR